LVIKPIAKPLIPFSRRAKRNDTAVIVTGWDSILIT